MMPGGVITRCTSLALPHQRCVLSSASQGMGSLPGEAQVEEGPRSESGPARDAGCLGEASVTEEGSPSWEVSLVVVLDSQHRRVTWKFVSQIPGPTWAADPADPEQGCP